MCQMQMTCIHFYRSLLVGHTPHAATPPADVSGDVRAALVWTRPQQRSARPRHFAGGRHGAGDLSASQGRAGRRAAGPNRYKHNLKARLCRRRRCRALRGRTMGCTVPIATKRRRASGNNTRNDRRRGRTGDPFPLPAVYPPAQLSLAGYPAENVMGKGRAQRGEGRGQSRAQGAATCSLRDASRSLPPPLRLGTAPTPWPHPSGHDQILSGRCTAPKGW